MNKIVNIVFLPIPEKKKGENIYLNFFAKAKNEPRERE